MFMTEKSLTLGTWQAFERIIARLLLYEGYSGIRIVGQSRDYGADIIAHKSGRRWLFQAKHWRKKVGLDVVDRTLESIRVYRAEIPVIVSLNGFEDAVKEHQRSLLSRGMPLQLWDRSVMLSRAAKLQLHPVKPRAARGYQETAISAILRNFQEGYNNKALVVMATGLGKTFTACEAVRRLNSHRKIRVLVIVHTNELVYQLEQSFWSFLSTEEETLVWNGYEHANEETLQRAQFVFACLNTIAEFVSSGRNLPEFDLVLIDECHHVGGSMYQMILESTRAGQENGPYLLGLTATPWRPDDVNLFDFFGEPLVSIDMVTGLKNGYLSNVDYRMYTDNINWNALKELHDSSLSPRQINRKLFINQWDDAVVYELQTIWSEHPNPKAIVFCGTIDHAITMRDRINSLGFCNAAAIYSQTDSGHTLLPHERNKLLADFDDGSLNVLCAVDILNEGIDVPDVNIIVFQRVTHSRRIFIQQLGRGLRISKGKDKVIVLDFVSDIRRFAAGLSLKDQLESAVGSSIEGSVRINLPHRVTFKKVGQEDGQTEAFLREWLEDVAAVESADEDSSVLKFPPMLPGGKQ